MWGSIQISEGFSSRIDACGIRTGPTFPSEIRGRDMKGYVSRWMDSCDQMRDKTK